MSAASRAHARRLALGRAAFARQGARGGDAVGGRAMGVSRFGFGRGGYDAVRRDLPETRDWNPGLGSADADSLGALPRLRAMSRDAMRNMPLAKGGMDTVRDNVVGTGLLPEPALDRDLLDLTDDAAEAWEARAKALVMQHLMSKGIDVRRQQTFVGLQVQALTSKFESGDCFALRRTIDRSDEMLATCFQLIEADRVATPLDMLENETVRDGIEVDPDTGEPIAYHVLDRHPGDTPFTRALGVAELAWGAARVSSKRVPARITTGRRWTPPLMLHVAELGRPEQTRGIPELAPVILLLKQITRYTDAELTAAVLSAFFTVFVTTPDGVGLNTGTGNPNVPLAANEVALGKGAVVGLGPGETVSIADPKRPNVAFDGFVQAILRQVGVALGLPFELLIKHFTASYSASRAALLEAWRSFKARQAWLVTAFCQPVYESVLAELVARGKLNAPGFFTDETKRRAWCGCEWHGPTMGQLNPLDEANAATTRIDAGITTIAEETVNITGGSWERNHRQRVKEVKRRVEDGLQPPLVAVVPRPAVQSTAETRDSGVPADKGAPAPRPVRPPAPTPAETTDTEVEP